MRITISRGACDLSTRFTLSAFLAFLFFAPHTFGQRQSPPSDPEVMRTVDASVLKSFVWNVEGTATGSVMSLSVPYRVGRNTANLQLFVAKSKGKTRPDSISVRVPHGIYKGDRMYLSFSLFSKKNGDRSLDPSSNRPVALTLEGSDGMNSRTSWLSGMAKTSDKHADVDVFARLLESSNAIFSFPVNKRPISIIVPLASFKKQYRALQ